MNQSYAKVNLIDNFFFLFFYKLKKKNSFFQVKKKYYLTIKQKTNVSRLLFLKLLHLR